MLAVMLELAKRVADRSPPLESTSAVSALAMFNTLSVRALTSSREYIRGAPEAPAQTERGGWARLVSGAACCQAARRANGTTARNGRRAAPVGGSSAA